MTGGYDFKRIEPEWQSYWEGHKTFATPNPGDPIFDPAKPKLYVLDMFPYPSGSGLHVGHPEGYTATDIVARHRRMRGYNVLHPMGWDSFGLPAEQHAVETGTHPRITTERNIATFRRQLKSLGFSYDWDRELATSDPKYYRWTQWIFLQLFKSWYDASAGKARPISELPIPPDVSRRGENAVREFIDSQRLAYLAEVPVNWCPALGTVLSNEEVTNDGKSDRGNHPVFRRPLKQWMLRITKYADRLNDDLADLDWPESIKIMQRNWIGRSEGADVTFQIEGHDETIETYTTCPDTLFGATFMVLAPEHPLVNQITTPDRRESVSAYCAAAAQRSDMARTAETKEKTGVSTGAFAVNPVNDERIPIWVADYVLITYGTGAIMAVPGSDIRDYEFAKAFGLPVVQVVAPKSLADAADGVCSTEEGMALYGQASNESGREYIRIDEGCFPGEGIIVNSPPRLEFSSRGMGVPCGTGVSPVAPSASQTSVTESMHFTRRNLPHIQVGGSTYFITFRTKHGELSAEERTIALRACDYWNGKKATMHAIVVMPDHVHMLLTPHERPEGHWITLTEILHSVKSYSGHEITKLRAGSGSVWLDESFDRIVRNEKEFIEQWEYIEANPITGGLVSSPGEYQWLITRQTGFQETQASNADHRRDAGATVSQTEVPQVDVRQDVCELNGLPNAEAKRMITAWLEQRGMGRAAVNYKLRDWLFSRQRYWGEPFPILHGPDGELVAVDESELPVELPEMDDFRPASMPEDSDADPEPPLGRAKDWVTVERDGKTFTRELNTMPQWAGSCWYYLRFLDASNEQCFCSREAESFWMVSDKKDGTPHVGGIDLYLGGAEHAVLHLLYARFWHKVLYDLGHVSTPEPFGKLYNQGMIRAFAYKDFRGQYVGYDDLDLRDDGAFHKGSGEKLAGAVEKMSKSLKNVVNPEDTVRDYGADSLRLYEMFMGPLDASKPWNPRDVPGVFRFLQRTWRLIVDEDTGALSAMVSDGEPDAEIERALHKTIRKVTDDIERMAFNTAISAMMEFVNLAFRKKSIHRGQAERFVLVLSPFAPHICEELWRRLLGDRWRDSLANEAWPKCDAAMIVDEEVEIPVQVNGKLAGRVTVAKDADENVVKTAAMASEAIVQRIGGGPIVKTIFVPGRMLNLIVRK